MSRQATKTFVEVEKKGIPRMGLRAPSQIANINEDHFHVALELYWSHFCSTSGHSLMGEVGTSTKSGPAKSAPQDSAFP